LADHFVNPDALAHHAAAECPNCAAAAAGNFCHTCGQETVLHPPSTREFVHEFIGHYVALEGKLWKSLGLLLFRPGRLTLEYIQGRRVRYVQPLRLYLTLSVIFFAVMQYVGHDTPIRIGTAAPQTSAAPASAPASGAQQQPVGKGELIHEDRPGEIREGVDDLLQFIGRINRRWADKAAQFADMRPDERGQLMTEAFYHYVPYAVFFMMPVFALYLKGLYLGSGRRYGEHLLFALHTNGFAYLAFTLMLLVPKDMGLGVLKWLLWGWLMFYLPAAMRRVYGGSRVVTGVRWIVLMVLHLLTMMLAVFGAVGFGIVH
jgi:hypothetical protein